MSMERPVTRQRPYPAPEPLELQLDPLFAATPPKRSKRRRRRWLELLLLLGFLFCLLLSLAALALFWNALRTDERMSERPLQSLRTDQIAPQLTLRALIGDPVDALAHQALTAGQLESSRVLLFFQGSANHTTRLSLLLQLARRFAQAGQTPQAISVYQQAHALAVLDATLASLERSQALIQCGEGYLAAQEPAAALHSANQALRIAQQAPDLLPAQRSQLFTSLQPLAEALGDEALRQQVAELVRNPFVQVSGTLLTSQLWSLLTAPSLDDTLTTAIATRQQRARELADRIAFTGGADIDPERIALAQALLLEDQARSAFLDRTRSSDLPPAQRLWLLLDHREWLLLKVQIAAQGFGLSLLPDWEANQAGLEREVAAVMGNLDALFNNLAAAQPDAITQASIRLEARLWLAAELARDLYFGGAPLEISQRIGQDQSELARLGQPLALPIGYDPAAIPPGFTILAAP
jgi:hypothetical protein